MPTIILFDGIKLEMFSNDHNPSHVHVKYAEHKCLLTIQTSEIYSGSMPIKPLKKAIAYVESHQADLMVLWNQLNKR